MTTEQRIDEALEKVLRAAGTSLKHYSTAKAIANMREEMRKIMSESYIKGSSDCFKTMADLVRHADTCDMHEVAEN